MSKKKKNPVGRPKAEIDLELVKKLCSMQCTAEEIASFLNVDADTLDARLKDAGYANFSEYYKKNSSGGKISLRRSQWKSSTDGNVTMQIWLGKQYLGQKDQPEQEPLDMSVNFFIAAKENYNEDKLKKKTKSSTQDKEANGL